MPCAWLGSPVTWGSQSPLEGLQKQALQAETQADAKARRVLAPEAPASGSQTAWRSNQMSIVGQSDSTTSKLRCHAKEAARTKEDRLLQKQPCRDLEIAHSPSQPLLIPQWGSIAQHRFICLSQGGSDPNLARQTRTGSILSASSRTTRLQYRKVNPRANLNPLGLSINCLSLLKQDESWGWMEIY